MNCVVAGKGILQIVVSKRELLTRGRRKLHSEKHRQFQSTPNILLAWWKG